MVLRAGCARGIAFLTATGGGRPGGHLSVAQTKAYWPACGRPYRWARTAIDWQNPCTSRKHCAVTASSWSPCNLRNFTTEYKCCAPYLSSLAARRVHFIPHADVSEMLGISLMAHQHFVRGCFSCTRSGACPSVLGARRPTRSVDVSARLR